MPFIPTLHEIKILHYNIKLTQSNALKRVLISRQSSSPLIICPARGEGDLPVHLPLQQPLVKALYGRGIDRCRPGGGFLPLLSHVFWTDHRSAHD